MMSTSTARTRVRRAHLIALVVLLVAAGGALSTYRNVRAQTEAPGRFAASMPRGALVYLEARDLKSLLDRWLASPVRSRYFESASYRSFTRSRLYLKLKERMASLEAGFGVAIDDTQLASLAGGRSAVAIYDPGKLEIVLATEVGRDRALGSALFAKSSSFEARQTAKGAPFFAREVAAGEGEGAQRIAFGIAGDVLWIGTSEALVAEAIDGAADGGLGAAVAETVRAAGDVTMHDMAIWFDMERSLRNKYFDLYWIHRNARELDGIASGMLDLELAPTGIVERRWYVRRDGAPPVATADAAALERLRAMAPPDAQLVEARATGEAAAPEVAEALFGPERPPVKVQAVSVSSREEPFEDADKRPPAGRYRYLDERYDRDVDDPAGDLGGAAAAPARPPFADRLAALVAPAAPQRHAVYGSVALAEGELFAGFDRAVVVELGAPERFDRAAFEALVAEEFGTRFVVGGDVRNVSWSDAGGVRSIAGALISQGGAYRVAGNYLVVARDAAACDGIVSRAASATVAAAGARPGAVRVAEVRVGLAAGPFKRLTSVLDARQRGTLNEDVSADGEQGASRPVLFFSENVASLLDVVAELAVVRIETSLDGAVLRERVDYLYSQG
jgi:hypothetical protein